MNESNIKVYAHCDAADGPAYTVKGNTVVEKEEAKVWGFHKIVADVFNDACVKVCDGCVRGYPKGGFGCIATLGGGSGSGVGVLRGVVQQVCSHLLSKGGSSLKVQICEMRGDVCVDLVGRKQGAKVSVDDKLGVSIDASYETCRSAESVHTLFSESLEGMSPLSQYCMLIAVQKGSTTLGRLFLLDAGDMTHLTTVERTPAEVDEQTSLSRAQGTLCQCITGIANGKDYRVLPFRDSKLTRIMQHPLHHATVGQSHVSLIYCLQQAATAQDTLCLLHQASLAQGSTPLKTISEYKDHIEGLEGQIEENSKKITQTDGNTKALASLYKMNLNERAKLHLELEGTEEKKQHKIAVSKKQQAKEHKREEVEKMDSLREGVIDAKRSLQMAQEVIDGVDGAVAAAVRRFADRHEMERREYRRKVEKQITKEKEANDKVAFDIHVKRRKAERLHAWEARVRKEVASLEAEKEELTAKASRATGPSRTADLTPEEMQRKAEYFRLLDEIDDLEQANGSLRDTVRELKEDTGMDVPTDSDESDRGYSSSDDESINTGHSSRDTSLPPSASSGLPDTDSDTDSISSSSSSWGSSSAGLGKAQLQHKRAAEDGALDLERRQFRFTLKKEQNLIKLVEQIMQYLEYGTVITLIQGTAPHVSRKYAYLTPGSRTHVNICDVDSAGHCNDKSRVLQSIKVSDIQSMGLGQSSKMFKAALREVGSSLSLDAKMPPSSQQLVSSHSTLGQYFYRSLTITTMDGAQTSFVAESDVDFEAWEVGIHRVKFLIPQWEISQDISRHTGASKLTEVEAHFCSDNHVTPLNFLNAKHQILARKQLLITLYDVRTASSLDLMHSQKLFELLITTGHIEKTILYTTKDPNASGAKKEGPDADSANNKHFDAILGITESVTSVAKVSTSINKPNQGLISHERPNLLKQGAGAAL